LDILSFAKEDRKELALMIVNVGESMVKIKHFRCDMRSLFKIRNEERENPILMAVTKFLLVLTKLENLDLVVKYQNGINETSQSEDEMLLSYIGVAIGVGSKQRLEHWVENQTLGDLRIAIVTAFETKRGADHQLN